MRCNNCGAEISDNALFCRVCGVRISESETLTNNEKTSETAEAAYYPESEIIPTRNGQNSEIYESRPDESKDYVNRSVLMTLVFGMIFGLIALFYALTARSCFEDGETESGIQKAKNALRLCRISLVFGIIKWLAIFSAEFLFIYII